MNVILILELEQLPRTLNAVMTKANKMVFPRKRQWNFCKNFFISIFLYIAFIQFIINYRSLLGILIGTELLYIGTFMIF